MARAPSKEAFGVILERAAVILLGFFLTIAVVLFLYFWLFRNTVVLTTILSLKWCACCYRGCLQCRPCTFYGPSGAFPKRKTAAGRRTVGSGAVGAGRLDEKLKQYALIAREGVFPAHHVRRSGEQFPWFKFRLSA